mmetsp:Transcript_4476/g.10854  ORF Transcript_4476/g.10854 Transcript_4476/m.10854 type:complete len:280 (-) Transcript_4476:192-1031(-)
MSSSETPSATLLTCIRGSGLHASGMSMRSHSSSPSSARLLPGLSVPTTDANTGVATVGGLTGANFGGAIGAGAAGRLLFSASSGFFSASAFGGSTQVTAASPAGCSVASTAGASAASEAFPGSEAPPAFASTAIAVTSSCFSSDAAVFPAPSLSPSGAGTAGGTASASTAASSSTRAEALSGLSESCAVSPLSSTWFPPASSDLCSVSGACSSGAASFSKASCRRASRSAFNPLMSSPRDFNSSFNSATVHFDSGLFGDILGAVSRSLYSNCTRLCFCP